MKTGDRREWLAAAAPALLLALAAAAAAALLAGTLEPDERTALLALLAPRAALLALAGLLLALGGGVLAHRAWLRWGAAPGQLAERLKALALSGAPGELQPVGDAGLRDLAGAANTLLRQRAELQADVGQKVQQASREIEQERSRLAALMSELTQSVVVCNLDGRVLLYNQRARAQFRALSDAPAVAGGAGLIGLGRSIYAVLDRQVVAHALERVQERLQRGAAHPTAQFVTGTPGGQLLRVQMAPFGSGEGAALGGFVLMLDNITRDFADESERDQLLQRLTEGSRASLGTLQAAVEMLDYADIDPAERERFLGVVRDEVRAMSQRVQAAADLGASMQRSRWPLEDMLGADLAAAAARRIEALYGCRVDNGEVDSALWLKVDSYSLLQAITGLAGRLADEYEVHRLRLRLAASGTRAHLDLVWAGPSMSTETAVSWETETMTVAGERSALTVREVAERHSGEFWFER